ncbi:MAG: hypothetical protein AAF485_03570 [Chloroflexota bacterium]
MFSINLTTGINLLLGLIAAGTAIYILLKGGWRSWQFWIISTIGLNFLNAAIRSAYYVGTIFWGWTRASHGNIVANINPLAFAADALALLIILSLLQRVWALEEDNQALKQKLRDYFRI